MGRIIEQFAEVAIGLTIHTRHQTPDVTQRLQMLSKRARRGIRKLGIQSGSSSEVGFANFVTTILHSVKPMHRLFPTPGHTVGHTSFAIASGGEYGFILGDVVISEVDAQRPEFANSFDWDNGVARTTRLRTLEHLIERSALVGASHLPAPGLGHFVRDGDGSRWEALPPS